MNVVTSGIFVSTLLFEQANSTGDIDGLLLGQTKSYTSQSIDDDSMDKTHFQKIYYIDAMIPALHLFEWYYCDGTLNKEGIKSILGTTNQKKVIGWFKSRRQTSLTASFREHLIHASLEDWSQALHGPDHHLVFMLISTQSNIGHGEPGSKGGLHTIDYQLSIKQNSKFFNIPSSIKNLGNFAKADYRNFSELPANHDDHIFQSTIEKHKHMFCENDENIKFANHVELLSKDMATKFENLAEDLKQSELQLQILSQENIKLKRQYTTIKEENKSKNISSNIATYIKEVDLMDMETDIENSVISTLNTSNESSELLTNITSNPMDIAFYEENSITPSNESKKFTKEKKLLVTPQAGVSAVEILPADSFIENQGYAEIHTCRETRSRALRKANGKITDTLI